MNDQAYPYRYERVDFDTKGKYVLLSHRPKTDAEVDTYLRFITGRNGQVKPGMEMKIRFVD